MPLSMTSNTGIVEKTMSLDLAEFHRSLRTLVPEVRLQDGQMEIVISADNSTARASVRIVYEPLEKATLGGLLALPRAKVTLHLEELDARERQIFLARFDKAFQRGGG